MTHFISLTKGQITKIEEEDFSSLSKFCWQAQSTRTKKGYYAVRNDGWNEKGTRLKVKMHREIMNCPKGLEVDHINGDTLDNRKSNLRICTHSDNIKNQKPRLSESKYRGVKRHSGKWRADISVNYKRIFLGLYDCEDEAGRAAQEARKKYYGEFSE